MVYSTRSDQAMVAKKPLKKARKKNGHLEQVGSFLDSHNVSFTRKNGKVVAVVERKTK